MTETIRRHRRATPMYDNPWARAVVNTLNRKFSGHRISANFQGRRFSRIVMETDDERIAHCFVDMDGNVYLAASWHGAAKGARFNVATPRGMREFSEAAEPTGAYLYLPHTPKKKAEAAAS